MRSYFHDVKTSMGAENLKGIFEDTELIQSTIRSICILDGDQSGWANSEERKNKNAPILVLPGNASIENLIFDYSKNLFDNDVDFWREEYLFSLGYTKTWYRDEVLKAFTDRDAKLTRIEDEGESTSGKPRELNKKIWRKYEAFLVLVMKHWINNPDNDTELKKLYKGLYILFKKVAPYHNINPQDWDKNIFDHGIGVTTELE